MAVKQHVDLLSVVVTNIVEARREDKARHETVMGAIDTLAVEMRTGFERVDARIDGLDARIDGLDARIDGLDARIDGVVVEMRTGFERLDARIDVLSDDVRKNTASIEQMRGWIAHDEAKLVA